MLCTNYKHSERSLLYQTNPPIRPGSRVVLEISRVCHAGSKLGTRQEKHWSSTSNPRLLPGPNLADLVRRRDPLYGGKVPRQCQGGQGEGTPTLIAPPPPTDERLCRVRSTPQRKSGRYL